MTPFPLYLVIDLSGGMQTLGYSTRFSTEPPNLDDDICRTTELWLRCISAGSFMMGASVDEVGRLNDEDLHQVTLTHPFYIGVFQVTQRQWELVMGTNPSRHQGETRPIDYVSYEMIRGMNEGTEWPRHAYVDADSFIGTLRRKTTMPFDLPTAAQWEYACRAGAKTALNSGQNLMDEKQCPHMDQVGRYAHNQNDGKGGYTHAHTKVGMYRPNAWGLYDMHGNVGEWCLDWYMERLGNHSVSNPKGNDSGIYRVVRGGGCYDNAQDCRSADRNGCPPDYLNGGVGLRMSMNILV